MKKNEDDISQPIALNFEIDDSIYPEDYEVDTKYDTHIKNFFLQSKTVNSISDYPDKIAVSSHPDNIKTLTQENNSSLGITEQMVEKIREEFSSFQEEIIELAKNLPEKKGNSFVIPKKEFNSIPSPTNEILVSEVLPYRTNRYCMKQIKSINKILQSGNKIENIEVIYLWLYTYLSLLKTPLVDDDNSILYSINKYLFKSLKENKSDSYKKVIYIIISEIFKQKVM